jgi:hypothetical protein
LAKEGFFRHMVFDQVSGLSKGLAMKEPLVVFLKAGANLIFFA